MTLFNYINKAVNATILAIVLLVLGVLHFGPYMVKVYSKYYSFD